MLLRGKDASMKPPVDYCTNTLAICWATVLLLIFSRDDCIGRTRADASPVSGRTATLRRSNVQAWLLFTMSIRHRG